MTLIIGVVVEEETNILPVLLVMVAMVAAAVPAMVHPILHGDKVQ